MGWCGLVGRVGVQWVGGVCGEGVGCGRGGVWIGIDWIVLVVLVLG